MAKPYGTPGPRVVHPDIAQDVALAGCSTLAQLLFDRLIVLADDQGRLRGTVTLVKANCLPLVIEATAEAVEAALTELNAIGLIIRYDALGEPLIQIRQWWRYQQGMRRAYKSRWAPPANWTDRVYETKAELDALLNGSPPRFAADRSGSLASAGAVPLPVPVPVPVTGSGDGQAGFRHSDAFKAHQAITGSPPSPGGRDMIEDLARRCGREALVAAMYAEPDTGAVGFLGRVKKRLVSR